MKRTALLLVILLACLFVCGCSFGIEFAVVNNSDSSIEVEYTVIPDWKALDHPTKKPLKTTLSRYFGWFGKNNWTEVPDNEFIYDADTKKCKLKLAPNEVLRITYASDLAFHNGKLDSFEIESLRLNGNEGEVFYSGKQFYKQFEKRDESNYFISYRKTDFVGRRFGQNSE